MAHHSDLSPDAPAIRPPVDLAIVLGAVFVAALALIRWPFGWTVLPTGWPQDLASAAVVTLCLAPLLWRLGRPSQANVAESRPQQVRLAEASLPGLDAVQPAIETPDGLPLEATACASDDWPLLNLDDPDTVPAALDEPERRRAPDTTPREPLARLPTRTEMLERVQQAIDAHRGPAGERFALLFLDVDRFRQTNDALGHDLGDEMLHLLATRLRLALRPADAVARVPAPLNSVRREAGDEFLVLVAGTDDRAEVASLAERLLEELSQPLRVGSHTLTPSLSMGVVVALDAALTAEQALRDCDTAMIEAKRAGRGRAVFFEAAMRERLLGALALEADMQRALLHGELFLLYQPLVELASHRLIGVEALLRWQHPQRDVLPPAEFLGIAEDCGLANALADFALNTACRQFARWRRELGAGAPPLVSINLASAQLQVPGMVQEVEAALLDNGMLPTELQIDVADGLVLQERPVLMALQALKKLGVRLAIDDFGAGSSSLASLHRLPFDTVKIDPSFVSRAHQVEHHRVLIEATVRVAHSRGMTVLAEGIETPAQAALMARMDCEQGQGWWYGNPLRADELAAWEAPPLASMAV